MKADALSSGLRSIKLVSSASASPSCEDYSVTRLLNTLQHLDSSTLVFEFNCHLFSTLGPRLPKRPEDFSSCFLFLFFFFAMYFCHVIIKRSEVDDSYPECNVKQM